MVPSQQRRGHPPVPSTAASRPHPPALFLPSLLSTDHTHSLASSSRLQLHNTGVLVTAAWGGKQSGMLELGKNRNRVIVWFLPEMWLLRRATFFRTFQRKVHNEIYQPIHGSLSSRREHATLTMNSSNKEQKNNEDDALRIQQI